MQTERVIIIDDDDGLRQSFAIILRSLRQYEIVNSYATCEEALRNLSSDAPDIVLMDLEMPGMGGIEGIRRVKSLLPSVEIIVITAHDNLELLVQAISAGAIGYITKTKDDFLLELISAIEEMKKGGAPLSPKLARQFIQSFETNKKSPLSPRETKVLKLLSMGKSYSVIADELFISPATVRAHIRNIYEKLEVHKKSEAIAHALERRLI